MAKTTSAGDADVRTAFPNGHFYSPVVDVHDAGARAATLWPATAQPMPGLDFNDASHRQWLTEFFPRFIADYQYPEHETDDPGRFFTRNSQFSWLDARAYFVALRQYRPARVIEVGAGFSTLLLADVKRRFLPDVAATCIEPYPRAFLRTLAGCELIEAKVQDVPVERFGSLAAGDILFIDSSHVSKTGSDVNFLCFEVLPRLRAGVLVHIHDIFLPQEYPRDWVLGENRSWNEQYVLRAFLMFNRAYQVLFGSSYAFVTYPELVRDALALPSGAAFAGGSLWLQRLD